MPLLEFDHELDHGVAALLHKFADFVTQDRQRPIQTLIKLKQRHPRVIHWPTAVAA